MDATPTSAALGVRILPLIDLTSLGDNDTEAKIEQLCADAITEAGTVAAVCVWPRFVATAASLLAESGVGVAAVANFPEGGTDRGRTADEARAIVADGGTEVDVVYPWRALQAGDRSVGSTVVATAREAVGSDVILKVILETGELEDQDLISWAARDAVAAGADFLKTSTGKTERSANPEAARVLLEVIADSERPVGLKVSGGVRTVAQALVYLELADSMMGPDWATAATFRFGASGLLADVLDAIG